MEKKKIWYEIQINDRPKDLYLHCIHVIFELAIVYMLCYVICYVYLSDVSTLIFISDSDHTQVDLL